MSLLSRSCSPVAAEPALPEPLPALPLPPAIAEPVLPPPEPLSLDFPQPIARRRTRRADAVAARARMARILARAERRGSPAEQDRHVEQEAPIEAGRPRRHVAR